MPSRKPGQGYAFDSSVPVDKSKGQIEVLLTKHGADGFHTGWKGPEGDDPGWDVIGFAWKGRSIRFRLARPKRASSQAALDQKNRQRWRILHLVIKAKLEAVQAGVSIFEEEFLAHIVTTSDKTVGEIILPRLVAGAGKLTLEAGRNGPIVGEVVEP